MSNFKFSDRSEANLADPLLDPRLVASCRRALDLTSVDFGVYEGVRTLERQREYVAKGVSWTMNSRHIKGQAVDLVPWIDGTYRWEWMPIYEVAEAMRMAWRELYPTETLRWGGCWCIVNAADKRHFPMKVLMENYVKDRLLANKTVRADGPHFEVFT